MYSVFVLNVLADLSVTVPSSFMTLKGSQTSLQSVLSKNWATYHTATNTTTGKIRNLFLSLLPKIKCTITFHKTFCKPNYTQVNTYYCTWQNTHWLSITIIITIKTFVNKNILFQQAPPIPLPPPLKDRYVLWGHSLLCDSLLFSSLCARCDRAAFSCTTAIITVFCLCRVD